MLLIILASSTIEVELYERQLQWITQGQHESPMMLLTQMEAKVIGFLNICLYLHEIKPQYISFQIRLFLFVILRGAAGTNLFGTPATDLTSNSGNTPPVQTQNGKI